MIMKIKDSTLDIRQVSLYCGFSEETVQNWIEKGELKATPVQEGHYRISVADLVDFLIKYNLPIPDKILSPGTKKVLIIVNEEKTVLDTLLECFKKENIQDFIIDCSAYGLDTHMKLFLFKPDLVLIDLPAPLIDGFDLCEVIKQTPEFSNTKVMVISRSPSDEKISFVKKLGIDALLPRNTEIRILLDKMKKLFENI